MANKFYAVKVGRKPGIYKTWSDCESQVKGFSGALYKSFSSQAEAEAFIGDMGVALIDYVEQSEPTELPNYKSTTLAKGRRPEFSERNHLIAYIDGSYNKSEGVVGAGGIMFLNGEEITFSFANREKKYTDFWNVSGELLGAMYVMNYAIERNIKTCSLYYDYLGIEMWATKKWKRNTIVTEEYANFYEKITSTLEVSFHKVAAHTGDVYNEIADSLAKAGAGLK